MMDGPAMETLAVIAIVGLAAGWGGWRALRHLGRARERPACGSGCEGCAHAGAGCAPPPPGEAARRPW